MSLFLNGHFAVSLALAAVLWTVQLVIYPAFRVIDARHFESWHYGYTGAITWIVAPLILLQAGGVAFRPFLWETPNGLWFLEASSTLLAWAVTGFVSIPIHKQLQKARTDAAVSALVRSNWWRTAAWSIAAICSGFAAHQ
ncbi:MAG: hypothetical protein EBS01_12310 [Verrucomicrobia bacterium]|nr:hypothetical protein [Verrucomicrobiota bacterium]